MTDLKFKAALACALAGCLAVGTASASYTAEIETSNSLHLDTVDIEVDGYAESVPVVLYGTQGAACTTSIANRGAACWVRVRVETPEGSRPLEGTLANEGEDGSSIGESETKPPSPDGRNAERNDARGKTTSTVLGSAADAEQNGQDAPGSEAPLAAEARWMKGHDGYYYLLDVLEQGKRVDFTEIVTHPDDGTWDGSGFEAERIVIAQAIQAQAFQPDFTAEKPWGGLEPEQAIYTRAEGTTDES